jgi:hypothetical protein
MCRGRTLVWACGGMVTCCCCCCCRSTSVAVATAGATTPVVPAASVIMMGLLLLGPGAAAAQNVMLQADICWDWHVRSARGRVAVCKRLLCGKQWWGEEQQVRRSCMQMAVVKHNLCACCVRQHILKVQVLRAQAHGQAISC